MAFFRSVFLASALVGSLASAVAQTAAPAEKARAAKPKPFEISHGNLFEALRQMAAYRKLDLLIDPDVPNQHGLYAFKHTTWEKALESLLLSHGLGAEIKDGILRIGLSSRFPADAARGMALGPERTAASRTISITYRPSKEGEAQLSVSATSVHRTEIIEALAKIERLAKAKPDRPFSANWVLRPIKNGSREELETFSMEDITPSGLRALYP